jgi:acylphosphatase
MKIAVSVIISGKVQGVWFRANTKEKADQIGVVGWVRNNPNGCVEAFFQGPEGIIQEMIGWCYKGPALALVKDLKIEKREPLDSLKDFQIKY